MLIDNIESYVPFEPRATLDGHVNLLGAAGLERDRRRTDVDRLEIQGIANGNRVGFHGIVVAAATRHVDFLERLSYGPEGRGFAIGSLMGR